MLCIVDIKLHDIRAMMHASLAYRAKSFTLILNKFDSSKYINEWKGKIGNMLAQIPARYFF